jgi:hypothetical protein
MHHHVFSSVSVAADSPESSFPVTVLGCDHKPDNAANKQLAA